MVVLERLNAEVRFSEAAFFLLGALEAEFVLHLQLDDPGMRKD